VSSTSEWHYSDDLAVTESEELSALNAFIYNKVRIITFYIDGITNPMDCVQDGPWFVPIESILYGWVSFI